MTFDSLENFKWPEQPPIPLFDLKFLNQFDNNTLKMRLLETFVRTVPGMCQELEDSFLNKDYKTLKDTAHKLKPNIDMMGIAIINEAIRNVEYCSLEGRDNHLQKEVQLINTILKEVVSAFKLMIAKD